MKIILTAVTCILLAGSSCAQKNKKQMENLAVVKTDAEWKKQLTAEQFAIARKAGTENRFTGKYWDNHEKGIYKCVCCGQELFTSDTSRLCGNRGQRNKDTADGGIPLRDQVVSIHRAQSGGQIVTDSRLISIRTGQTVGRSRGAGNDIVPTGNIGDHAGSVFRQPVKLGVDITEPGLLLETLHHLELVEQRHDTREGGR